MTAICVPYMNWIKTVTGMYVLSVNVYTECDSNVCFLSESE